MESSIHVILPTVPSRSLRREEILNPLYWSLHSISNQKDVKIGQVVVVEDLHQEAHVDNLDKILKTFKEEGLDISKREAKDANTCGEVRNEGFEELKELGISGLILNWEDDAIFCSRRSLRKLQEELERNGCDAITPAIHIRKILWRDFEKELFEKYKIENLYGVIFEGLPTMDGHHSKSKEVFEKRGVGIIKIDACNDGLDGKIYPFKTFENGLGEEPLASILLVSKGYKFYRTSKSCVLHFKFGRPTVRNELEGRMPEIDYDLPIPLEKMIEISRECNYSTGCSINPKKYKTYFLAQVMLLYSATHSKDLKFGDAKQLLRFHSLLSTDKLVRDSFLEYLRVWKRVKKEFKEVCYSEIVYKKRGIRRRAIEECLYN